MPKINSSPLRLGMAIWFNQEFGRRVFAGVRRHLEAHPSVELELLSMSSSGVPFAALDRIDGLIAVVDSGELPLLQRPGLPLVVTPRSFLDLPVPCVAPDPFYFGQCAAEYFLSLHLQNLVVCGFSPHACFDQLCAGFSTTAEPVGIQVLPAWTTRDESPENLATWLDTLPRPIGILCKDDINAGALVRAAERRAYDVPKDIAVLGIGDDPIACFSQGLSLSSIAVDPERLGSQACAALMTLIAEGSVESCAVKVGQVQERASTCMLGIDDAAVVDAVMLIRRHLDQSLSTADIANRIGLSRRTLEHRFRQALGCSPHEETIRVRIERAKHLLANTELPIKAIARAVGMTHDQHFCRFFKQHTSLTPNRFRERAKT